MKRIPKAIYQTVEELESNIRMREAEAAAMAPGAARQSILKDIAQLKVYSDAKRWIASPGLKPGA